MKPRQNKRKQRGFFRRPDAGRYVFAFCTGAVGLLLLVSGLHMTLVGDATAYTTKLTAQGPRRDEVGPSFLYIMGTAMLAWGLFVGLPSKKQNP